MRAERLMEILEADFYTGVPDSQLRAFCDILMATYGTDPRHHVVAANEGNAAALAAGYHLATGKIPVVYMQNSGEGNIINPVASLMNVSVYGIPCIFVLGWRGEPGVHDEPQHIYQGKVTLRLLEDMDIQYFAIEKDTRDDEVASVMERFREVLIEGKQAAFVIRKGALLSDVKAAYGNGNTMLREEIIRHVTEVSGDDPVVSTTGKASRELFEIREVNGQPHSYDFLTVGSMGHSSSIALGIALQRPDRKIWIIDGDGAVLMHMGSMAVIGASGVKNLVHVVINNGAHESVGGMPTAAGKIDLVKIAEGCGYAHAVSVDAPEELDVELRKARRAEGISLIEVKCAVGARADLGRPTTTAQENKEKFMRMLLG